MSLTLADRLTSLAPPWAHVAVLAPHRAALSLPELPEGFVARTLDGRRCAGKSQLLDEFARVFGFPVYFGQTWDGIEDCLTDLEWLPATGYVLMVALADLILRRQPSEYGTLVDLLTSVRRAWATGNTGHPDRGARPFHSLLVVSARGLAKRQDWRLPRIES